VAGGVVGGVVGLAIITGLFLLLRRAWQSRIVNKLQGNLQPLVEAESIDQQMHEMPHNRGENRVVNYGDMPNGNGYVPCGADHKVVQVKGLPREMPTNQPELVRHELA
jgi:hypothetical protein